MRFAVLAARYALSGVPLAQERLARALARRGHQVDFIVGLVNPGHAPPRADGVRVLELGQGRVRTMLLPLARYLREARPDAVFSAGDHLNAVVLAAAILARSKAKVSCSSRVTPFDTYSRAPWLKWVMRSLAWRADALTCVSEDMVQQYRTVFPGARHVCAYNIVVPADLQQLAEAEVEEPWGLDGLPLVVAAGALEAWKGFDDLLRAMVHVKAATPARLLLLGDGPERAALERLRTELGLDDVVRMPGFVRNPLRYFARADVFVLSSRVEGLPNVLVEAMACGASPVATDCPTGPREVLAGGRHGALVPVGDAAALGAAVVAALRDPVPGPVLRQAVQPFTEEAVVARQFALLGLPLEAS